MFSWSSCWVSVDIGSAVSFSVCLDFDGDWTGVTKSCISGFNCICMSFILVCRIGLELPLYLAGLYILSFALICLLLVSKAFIISTHFF